MRNGTKYLTKHLSGHMHFCSPYETDNDCGNCDGVKCDCCHDVYKVEDYANDELYYLGNSYEEAIKILNE